MDKNLTTIKEYFNIILIAFLGVFSVIFSILYIETFSYGFLANYSAFFIAVILSIISSLTVLTIYFFRKKTNYVYKIFYVLVVIVFIVSIFLFLLKKWGILDKVSSIEEFRNYISSFNNAWLIFIVLQFLQVVVLPIPAFITVCAGVLMFGPFFGAFYSFIGIVFGSILPYFIGKLFGVKVVSWLVGEKNLNKGLKIIKGKDKVVLTFMFLFPLFPDDILCFVAGITTIKPLFFIVMITVTRLISIFVSAYSMNNSIIPYTTWWGIILWIIFISLTLLLTIYIYKNGNKIEKLFLKKKKRKNIKKD